MKKLKVCKFCGKFRTNMPFSICVVCSRKFVKDSEVKK